MLLRFITACLISTSVFAAGKVTFIKGDITSLHVNSKQKLPGAMKLGAPILAGHSYLTGELSQVVVKLPDETWVRIGSETKFELHEEKDRYVVILYTGSLRVLYAQNLQKTSTKSVVVKTEDAWIETSGAKFTVTYMPLFQHTSVYVDKGLVQLSSQQDREGKVPETIHSSEYSELVKTEGTPRSAKKMSEKEQQMLKTLLFAQLKEKKKEL